MTKPIDTGRRGSFQGKVLLGGAAFGALTSLDLRKKSQKCSKENIIMAFVLGVFALYARSFCVEVKRKTVSKGIDLIGPD